MRRFSLSNNGVFLFVAVAAVLCSLFLTRNVDLRVYWYAVTGFFSGTRPAYGFSSGIGFPMEYRYPPVTYLLLSPLKLFSLRVAGFLWMLAAWANATVAVTLAIRIRGLHFSGVAMFACLAFLASDLVLAVRYGNVQPFVIAWLLLALVVAERWPVYAGILLTLAVTFKIWPILFLPWFIRRTRWRAALWFGISFAALWLSPVFVFGVNGYANLLHDWYVAVARVGNTYSELYYFPGQSLRGLLLRLITPVSPALSYFPDVHVVSFEPRIAVTLWSVIASVAYGSLTLLMWRSNDREMLAWDGLIFVIYSMIEPFAVKSGLISLAPSVLIAASLYTSAPRLRDAEDRTAIWANRLFLAACGGSFAEALLQYKPMQRWLLSVGVDFWWESLLVVAYLIWIRSISRGSIGTMVDDRQLRPADNPVMQ